MSELSNINLHPRRPRGPVGTGVQYQVVQPQFIPPVAPGRHIPQPQQPAMINVNVGPAMPPPPITNEIVSPGQNLRDSYQDVAIANMSAYFTDYITAVCSSIIELSGLPHLNLGTTSGDAFSGASGVQLQNDVNGIQEEIDNISSLISSIQILNSNI